MPTSNNGNTTVNPAYSYSQDGNCSNDNLSLDPSSSLSTAADDGGAIGATGGSSLIDDDGDGVSGLFDCDDNDAQAYPGAAPNDSTTACMVDSDGDGYGDSNPSSPFAVAGTDCDDSAALINPASPEVCDGVDNDCSGLADDNPINGQYWCPDLDADGYGNSSQGDLYCILQEAAMFRRQMTDTSIIWLQEQLPILTTAQAQIAMAMTTATARPQTIVSGSDCDDSNEHQYRCNDVFGMALTKIAVA